MFLMRATACFTQGQDMLVFTRRSQRETFQRRRFYCSRSSALKHTTPHIYGSVTCSDRNVFVPSQRCSSLSKKRSLSQLTHASPKPRNTRSVGVTAFSASLLMGLRGRGRGEPSFSLHLSQENIHSHTPLHLAFYNT